MYKCIDTYMSGEQLYLPPAMDMAKVGRPPISSEGLYFHAMCNNMVSASGCSPIGL
jgi:hypothetical protein